MNWLVDIFVNTGVETYWCKTGLSPPVKYFTDRSKAVLLLGIFYVFVLPCVCYVFVRVCLYVLCGHLLGKGWPLGSRLWCLTVSLSLSHWFLIFAPLLTLLINKWRWMDIFVLMWIGWLVEKGEWTSYSIDKWWWVDGLHDICGDGWPICWWESEDGQNELIVCWQSEDEWLLFRTLVKRA